MRVACKLAPAPEGKMQSLGGLHQFQLCSLHGTFEVA